MRCVTAAFLDLNVCMQRTTDREQARVLGRLNQLLQGGCDLDETDEDGETGLLRLCKGAAGLGSKTQLAMVKAFLAMGADAFPADADGNTALHYAAQAGNAALVDLLCSEGDAPVDARNAYGSTPLLVATSQGHLSVVEILIAHGADVNVPDQSQNTPLHIACEYGRCLIARTLIDHGADLTAKNALQQVAETCSWGETALLFVEARSESAQSGPASSSSA